jgi:hypothetical protein
MVQRGVVVPAVMLAAVLAGACGSSEPAKDDAAPEAAHAGDEHADHGDTAAPAAAAGGARVLFVEPKEGAELTSPVHFVFGAENFTIAAVPEGEVTTSRPNTGHYHLGVEMDCMTPDQVIPKGTPSWVHFGKGDSTFDLQLTPGTHKVALQVGDDLHKTIPGLCQVMTFTVK